MFRSQVVYIPLIVSAAQSTYPGQKVAWAMLNTYMHSKKSLCQSHWNLPLSLSSVNSPRSFVAISLIRDPSFSRLRRRRGRWSWRVFCFTSRVCTHDTYACRIGRRSDGGCIGGDSRACPGPPFLKTLQGGYNLDSISKSALAVTKVLLGEAPDELPPLQANEAATETVWLVAREQSKYWKSVDPKACEPREG